MANTDPRVAVVGSYNTGLTMSVPRFPVPGETVMGSDYQEGVGGKGSNQAIGAARLGAEAVFVGRVGTDRHAEAAFDRWEREGVDTEYVRRTDEAHTGVGVVLVDEAGENEIAVAPGANHEFSAADVRDAASAIERCDVLLVQLEVQDDVVRKALAVAADAGLTTVLNPAPARELPADLLESVDFLTPNRGEARILAGFGPDEAVSDDRLAAELRETGVGTVAITLGEDGALVQGPDREERVPTPSVDVVDTTGAGDAFNAGLAVALAEGRDPVDAVRFGCIAGALSTTEMEVVPGLPDRETVEERLS